MDVGDVLLAGWSVPNDLLPDGGELVLPSNMPFRPRFPPVITISVAPVSPMMNPDRAAFRNYGNFAGWADADQTG